MHNRKLTMNRPRFVIESTEAESMAKDSNLTILQLLQSLVKSAQTLARAPISNFNVGAVGLGSDGRIFVGVNLEFPGLPLHHSVHAEQFLVTNLAFHGEPNLRYIAVSDAPCGHCRQFLQELRHASDIQILITKDSENPNFNPLSSMLPNPFGPRDLLDEKNPLLLDKQNNGLSLKLSNDNSDLCNGVCELVNSALKAANNSHAPYSGSPSGVALMDCEGKIYSGWYMESAAYNPSLGPVQAAVVAYVAGGGGGYERIVAAVLVEKGGAVVKQEDTARLLLKFISPNCEVKVFNCDYSNGCK